MLIMVTLKTKTLYPSLSARLLSLFLLLLASTWLQIPSTSADTDSTAVGDTRNNNNNNDDSVCPQGCRCGNQKGNVHAPNVDCSGSHLKRPPRTPISTLTLDISRNNLGAIINDSLPRMLNLTYLDLSYNSIRRLLACTFNGMISMKTLSLRGNLLTSLPESLFADSQTLEHLDLSHNLFAVLPDDVFRNTPNLKTLDFSNNRAAELKLGLRFQVGKH